MKVLALFLWTLVPLGLWLAVEIWGTPHVLSTYRYIDTGNPYSTAPRRHIDCTYVGWAGPQTVPAKDARCAWIAFFRREGG